MPSRIQVVVEEAIEVSDFITTVKPSGKQHVNVSRQEQQLPFHEGRHVLDDYDAHFLEEGNIANDENEDEMQVYQKSER